MTITLEDLINENKQILASLYEESVDSDIQDVEQEHVTEDPELRPHEYKILGGGLSPSSISDTCDVIMNNWWHCQENIKQEKINRLRLQDIMNKAYLGSLT